MSKMSIFFSYKIISNSLDCPAIQLELNTRIERGLSHMNLHINEIPVLHFNKLLKSALWIMT